jgi:hypothetical protein
MQQNKISHWAYAKEIKPAFGALYQILIYVDSAFYHKFDESWLKR